MRRLKRLPRETGRDYTLRTLRDNIIRLELAPGSPISENEVAVELGLSRTPVREAFLELSKVRIIETFPQKKSVVSLIDYDLVEEARFMREVLETAVVQLACELAGPNDLSTLQENIRLQRYFLNLQNMDQLMALDNDFHALLFTIAKKPQVFEQINNISIHFDRVRNMALSSVKDLKIVNDHEAIALAVSKRDAGAARALMERHLNRYKVDAAVIRQRFPNYIKQ